MLSLRLSRGNFRRPRRGSSAGDRPASAFSICSACSQSSRPTSAGVTHRGTPIGRWVFVAWDRRRFVPPFARQFGDELVVHVHRNYPGPDVAKRAPRGGGQKFSRMSALCSRQAVESPMSASGRFCCRSRLKASANNDSLTLTRSAAGTDDDGSVGAGPRTAVLFVLP